MELLAKYTLFAEGCRGSLSQELMQKFNLRDGIDPQKYGIGLKELWQVAPGKHQKGLVMHSQGWPLDANTGGGSFLYHLDDDLVAVGFVVHLNYENPHLSPFDEFQRFKTHPAIRATFEGGKRLGYGARAINEGGLQSVPKLAFPGGALIGCSAGFVNLPRIKGSHNAMKTGMLAAESAFAALGAGRAHDELADYPEAWRKSWVYEDLYKVRNVKPGLNWGMWVGSAHGGIHMWLNDLGLGALVPWTLRHDKPDNESLKPAAETPQIDYPKPDGVLTFDKLSSVFVSNTNHEEDQPVHLQLRNASVPVDVNLARLRRPGAALLPGRRIRIRPGRRRRAGCAKAADQCAELRALQDLRHQGPAPEHPLGDARGRRRAELHRNVTLRPRSVPQPCRSTHAARIAVRMPGEPRVDAVGEYPLAPLPGNVDVEALDIRHAAAQHDHVGIDDVDDVRQRSRQPVLVARQGGLARGIAAGSRGDNVGSGQRRNR